MLALLHSAFLSGGSRKSSRCRHEGQHCGRTAARFLRGLLAKGGGQRWRVFGAKLSCCHRRYGRRDDCRSSLLKLPRTRFWMASSRQTRQHRRIRGLFMNANDKRGEEGADSPELIQWDAGKGDAAGCDCGFLLRTAAEISVMTSPIGKGSMNVIAALRSGLSYISLYFFTC